VLEHKSGNISETRKDRGKVTMEGLTNGVRSFEWYHPIISGTGKATDFKFGRNIHSVHLNKSPLKILEKREGGLPNFLGTPYYVSNG